MECADALTITALEAHLDANDFGTRLRQLRHDRQETLEQVSAETGLSVAMLSRVERGERLPSPESVEALAGHFGLPVDDLMSDTIASRMFNRYGRESSNRAAERMTGEPGGRPAESVVSEARAPAPSHARGPMRRAGMAFSAQPIEDLFGEDAASDALSDAVCVAEVALDSALAAARRAIASGDPSLEDEGHSAIQRLRTRANEGR